MIRPDRLADQIIGKANAEASRGSGAWPLQGHPVDLEPPWECYDERTVNSWDCWVNEWEASWEGNLIKRALLPGRKVLSRRKYLTIPPAERPGELDLSAITIARYADDESTIPLSDQFLRSLPMLRYPVAFELAGYGAQPIHDYEYAEQILRDRVAGIDRAFELPVLGWTAPAITTQYVAHRADRPRIERLLLTHYPNSAVVSEETSRHDGFVSILADIRSCEGYAGTLCLKSAYCMPLRSFVRIAPDPLGVAISAMEQLGPEQWAILQVLFQPTRYPWEATLRAAMTDPYTDGLIFDDIEQNTLSRKFRSPLFAVSVRIASSRQSVFRQLEGWAKQFATAKQGFDDLLEEGEAELFAHALDARCTYRPGVLLNTEELAGLTHLPSHSVASDRLLRVSTRTNAAPQTQSERSSVILGENIHRGKRRVARIPASLRPRHCYIAGASGTGKSTLLLNMILQDIAAGEGVGLLDPHGDLVTDVLKRIPSHRIDDVILFDPSDTEFPFALNILDAADRNEAERIVAETIMALQRFFPASWGQRLERILTFTLYTVIDAIPGATLADVERMLIDHQYREYVIQRTKTKRYADFWDNEFVYLPKNAVDPVLNRISVFLLKETVSNIICQRTSSIDFDGLLNDGKILLANLSTGLLTEQIAGTLGSFLTTKIVNAAFRRAAIPEAKRRPFYLYIDEFQNFMNLSVGFDRILSEARKYKLVLAGLANQYVGQLTPSVRAAIFGNVGSMMTFRLGTDDAGLLQKELGGFTAEEILNLEVGQAFGRIGGSATSFNLKTYPPPPVESHDPTRKITALCRHRYAKPRSKVASEFKKHDEAPSRPESQMSVPTPSVRTERPQQHTSGKNNNRGSRKNQPKTQSRNQQTVVPSDPSEDDLVT